MTKHEVKNENHRAFREGMRDGVPISLGYLAVSFSLGIAASNIGFSPFQAFLVSLLNNASAGEYAGFSLIAENATYLEVALITLVANARYLLMSCALSQRISPDTPQKHRFLLGYDLTDEIFGITIARPGYINPFYTYGAVITALPCWSIGTALGALAGNLMPVRLVSAFSVALYGMFLAIIIPPASKKYHIVTGLVIVCFIASCAAAYLPLLKTLSAGTRTIVLTVVLSALAAILFPVKEEQTK